MELDVETVAGGDKGRESVLVNPSISAVPGADMILHILTNTIIATTEWNGITLAKWFLLQIQVFIIVISSVSSYGFNYVHRK